MEEPETLSPSTEQSRVLAHHFHAARAEAMDIAAQSQFTRGLRAPYQPDLAALAEIGPRAYEYEDDDMAIDWPDYDDLEEQSLPESGPTNSAIRGNWERYHANAKAFKPFSRDFKHALNLLFALRRSKASLDTYEGIAEWHFRTTKAITGRMTLGNCPAYISREKVFKTLRERYNMPSQQYSQVHRIRLPFSKAGANVVCNSAELVLQSLLTDPRIQAKDYLFFNDDPFAPPPRNLNYVADLNTGLSYTETYRKLITKPGQQVLLPVLNVH